MIELEQLTADQIQQLNRFQNAGRMHPFTCPNRGDGNHREFNGDKGALVATRRSWICPWCDYTQAWAHEHMIDPRAAEPFRLPDAAALKEPSP